MSIGGLELCDYVVVNIWSPALCNMWSLLTC